MTIIFANLQGRTRFLPTRFWGKDISALDKLIRVPYKIGPRIALGGNDMYLCGLYDTTIYEWMNRGGLCFFVELWSEWRQALSVSRKRRLPQNIS